eukprot:3934003-Rhodomonas_salina.1
MGPVQGAPKLSVVSRTGETRTGPHRRLAGQVEHDPNRPVALVVAAARAFSLAAAQCVSPKSGLGRAFAPPLCAHSPSQPHP